MDNSNYITIQGWMVKELKLRGNELLVFAIIYGFTQDGESRFQGSCAYLADWLGSSRQTALNMLNLLTNKGLITRTEKTVNGLKVCDYAVNCALLATVQNFNTINICNNNTLTNTDIRENNTNKYGVQNLDTDQKCAPECASPEEPAEETKEERIERTFSVFWTAYPRKVDKERARRAWRKIAPSSQQAEEIMAALDRQKSAGILNTKDQYTPYPATWINGQRWRDIIVPKTTVANTTQQAVPAAEDYLTDGGAIICNTSDQSS